MIERIKTEKLIRYTFLTAILVGLCTHLPIMLSDIPNHDGLSSIYFDQNMITSGRWFLSIACGFSSYYSLPWLIGLLSILLLAVTSVLLVEVLEIKKVSFGVLTAGLLVTFPVLTSTFAYVFTMDGYMLSLLLSVLAVYLVSKGRYGFLFGGIALAFSLGIYQAYLPVCILLCLYKVILTFLEEKDVKVKVKTVMSYLLMGVIGAILYYIILQILLFVQHTQLASYQGINEMTGFSLKSVTTLYTDFIEFILTGKVLFNNVFSILAFGMLLLLFAGTFIQVIWQKKLYKSVWFYIVFILIVVIIPAVCNIILVVSQNVSYHTLMRYQYVILVMEMLAFTEKYGTGILRKSEIVLIVSVGVLIFNYIVTDNIAYSNLEKKYEKTYAYCLRLADRMEQTEGYYQGIPVAMIGVVSENEYPVTDVTKDVTSKLLGITGDYLLYTGENYKAFFENYLGITINLVSGEEMSDIYYSEEYWEMNSFPAKDSMKVVNGILYIKTENRETTPWEMK